MKSNRKYYLEDKQQCCLRDKTVMDYFSVSEEGVDEFYVGYICLLKTSSGVQTYSVRRAILNNQVAVANSLDEAIAALAAHYEENPPWWHGQTWQHRKRAIRETRFGRLCVDEIKPGKWAASRRGRELLIKGETAIFSTCEEAQRAADAHFCADQLDDSETINDGFSWACDPVA
jgi:hypothetical protein